MLHYTSAKIISMSDTREKLGEAEYFYQQMKTAFIEGRSEYVYLINAFVSASRSVTFVMQKEYAKSEGFTDWWSNNEAKKTQSFDSFNSLRTITEHQRLVNKSGHVWGATFNFGEGIESKDGIVKVGFNFEGSKPTAHVIATNEDGSEREVEDIAGEIKEDIIITEYRSDTKKEVKIESFFKEADSYFEAIKQIVSDCEAKFGIK